jgi:hypothetical protein
MKRVDRTTQSSLFGEPEAEGDPRAPFRGAEGPKRKSRRGHQVGATTVRCRANECGIAIDAKLLMCGKHWRLVPESLRRGVWRHYRDGQRIDTATAEYFQAAAEAVEAVARAEGKDPANWFRQRAEELRSPK